MEYRWTGGNPQRARVAAAEMADLAPEVILCHSGPMLLAMRDAKCARSPLSSCRSLMPLARASSRAWRARAATSPVSPILSPRWVASGLRSSRRSRRRSGESPCYTTRNLRRRGPVAASISAPSRPSPRPSRCTRPRSRCATQRRWSAALPRFQPSRTAGSCAT